MPRRNIFLYALMIFSSLFNPAIASGEHPVTTVRVEGSFFEKLQDVRVAIQGRGINIAHTLPASGMLNRTGSAFGVERNVFIHAEIIEFCSAKISHKLIQANPENIVLCPFTIGIYELTSDPGYVHLTYRKPFVLGDEVSPTATSEIVQLIEGIVKDATEW
jgi:uncharacterized protein (DUF302 family)